MSLSVLHYGITDQISNEIIRDVLLLVKVLQIFERLCFGDGCGGLCSGLNLAEIEDFQSGSTSNILLHRKSLGVHRSVICLVSLGLGFLWCDLSGDLAVVVGFHRVCCGGFQNSCSIWSCFLLEFCLADSLSLVVGALPFLEGGVNGNLGGMLTVLLVGGNPDLASLLNTGGQVLGPLSKLSVNSVLDNSLLDVPFLSLNFFQF